MTEVQAEYLEVIATRSSGMRRPDSPGRRAISLADRIEQGAATLAGFVGGLSNENWSRPASGSDKRSVGTLVHHVASVYPIEIQLAQAIAEGHAVTDVTWKAVAELNAKHAAEHPAPDKFETLELLARNSRDAAAAVRAFTEEQMDRAAPFSLSFGAPMTAQFVIEDHAVRHSWQHLAQIKSAVAQ